MTTTGETKCAYLSCRCWAQPGDKYCGQACKEAGSSKARSHAGATTERAL
jgi:hypothetical protein